MVIVYDKKSILEGVNFFSRFFSLGQTHLWFNQNIITSSGACLGQHLGHIVNNGQQSAVLHASVMPFFLLTNGAPIWHMPKLNTTRDTQNIIDWTGKFCQIRVVICAEGDLASVAQG